MNLLTIFRPDAVRVFLERLEHSALSRGVRVNVKVTYFSQDSHSTFDTERELRELLEKIQKKYPQRKFEILSADGAFSRGRGNFFIYLL